MFPTRRLIVLVAASCALTAVPSFAADPDAPPLSQGPGYDQVIDAILEQEAQADARERWLDTPENRQERAASRTEFVDESGAEARELFRDAFSEVLDTLDWVPSELEHQNKIKEFEDDFTARVTVGGRRQLMDSQLPIRTTDEDGDKVGVDLAMEAGEDGFAPIAPLVPVEFPREPAEGLKFGDGPDALRMRLVGAHDASGAAAVDEHAVSWHEAARDTDLVAAPIPEGLEAWLQLRSSSSPEESRWRFDGPTDLRLAKNDRGDVDVLSGDERIAIVPAPTAVDAQGQDVPVAVAIDGVTLVLRVEHRTADFAYPIAVDPAIKEDWVNLSTGTPDYAGGWYHGYAAGLDRWAYYENPQGWYVHADTCTGGIGCYGTPNGLGKHIYSYSGLGYSNPAGHFAEWIYRVPRHDQATNTAFIPRVEYAWQYNRWYTATSNMALVPGIWDAWRNQWVGWHILGQVSGAYSTVIAGDNVPGSNTTAGKAAVWAVLPSNGATGGNDAYFGGAVVFLDDTESPALGGVSHSGAPPSGWTKDFSSTVTFSGTDNGLGVNGFDFYKSGNRSIETKWINGPEPRVCRGTRGDECPTSASASFTYAASQLPEGDNPMGVCVRDVLWKTSCGHNWSLKVDRSAPVNTLGGDLYARRDETLPRQALTLRVTSTDGSTSSLATRRSGVKRMLIYVDSTLRYDSGDVACAAGSCPMTRDFTLDPAWLTAAYDGETNVRVWTFDHLNNSTITDLPLLYKASNHDPNVVGTDNGQTSAIEFGDPQAGEGCIADSAGICQDLEEDEKTAQAAAVRPIKYGLADDSTNYFLAPESRDTRFDRLALRQMRKLVPWDIAIDNQRATQDARKTLQAWYDRIVAYNAANPTKQIVMTVSFNRHRGASVNGQNGRDYLPTLAEYGAAVQAFRTRWPAFKYFSAWNEINDGNQPTRRSPVRAAQYWNILDKQCRAPGTPRCYVAAGEFVDQDQGLKIEFIDQYMAGLKNYAERWPSQWAWHAYTAGKTGSTSKLKAFLKRSKSGEVWLTENGGVLRQGDAQTGVFDTSVSPPRLLNAYNEEDQAIHVKRILNLPRSAATNRISKIFIYQWVGDSHYDAGLLDYVSGGVRAREAYWCFMQTSNPTEYLTAQEAGEGECQV